MLRLLTKSEYAGASFALASGTSMAAPHVAGIAALVKQKNPSMSPAAIASALTSTASTVDQQGLRLQAQQPSYNLSMPLGPACPFDFGGGEVNPTAAVDPGLVFNAGIILNTYYKPIQFVLMTIKNYAFKSIYTTLLTRNQCVYIHIPYIDMCAIDGS